jgi:hypothetical protein
MGVFQQVSTSEAPTVRQELSQLCAYRQGLAIDYCHCMIVCRKGKQRLGMADNGDSYRVLAWVFSAAGGISRQSSYEVE